MQGEVADREGDRYNSMKKDLSYLREEHAAVQVASTPQKDYSGRGSCEPGNYIDCNS